MGPVRIFYPLDHHRELCCTRHGAALAKERQKATVRNDGQFIHTWTRRGVMDPNIGPKLPPQLQKIFFAENTNWVSIFYFLAQYDEFEGRPPLPMYEFI